MNAKEQENLAKIEERINSGEIVDQRCWKFIKEMNSFSEERLDTAALINGKREFTYRQLFRQWDRYAEVFFAMKIMEKNNSRVAMYGNVSAECIIAFYALNMNGVPVSMLPVEETYDEERWMEMIRKEEITDLIIAEVYAWPKFLNMIYFKKKELGLRNIIILPTYLDGPYAASVERLQARLYEQLLNLFPDFVRMDDLIKEYEAAPFTLGTTSFDEASVITHTSGTTKGIHKPIPLSDKALNAAAANMYLFEPFKKFHNGDGRTAMTMEMSAAYCMVDMVHVPLALGCTNIIIPMGAYNPKFHLAIRDYGVNLLLGSAQQFMEWKRIGCEKCGKDDEYDFSALEFVALGGEYVSTDNLKKINTFIKEHGGHVRAVSGYGLSEAGGACILPDPEEETRDTIGYPLPGVDIRIYDEDKKVYYMLEDGPRTGGLYISSDSISSGRIGDRVFFEHEEIDGKPFICTYDLVKVEEDGSLTFAGRMNRFFANNEGVRFDAGIIETALSKCSGIEGCAIVPKYVKDIYDTIPVLFVQPCTFGSRALRNVRDALLDVFGGEKDFDERKLPSECVITERIPRNDAGKIDIHRITQGIAEGTSYIVRSIVRDGILKDIRFEKKCHEKDKTMVSSMIDGFLGMGCDEEPDDYSGDQDPWCDFMPEGMGCDQFSFL